MNNTLTTQEIKALMESKVKPSTLYANSPVFAVYFEADAASYKALTTNPDTRLMVVAGGRKLAPGSFLCFRPTLALATNVKARLAAAGVFNVAIFEVVKVKKIVTATAV